MKPIQIKYHSSELVRINKIEIGNWIDLRAAESVTLQKGEHKLISLGVSMKLPSGYEAWIVPRSSTYKTWGIILANHMGIIDNTYCGTDDIWYFSAIAMRDTTIQVNDRICQFRVMPVMEEFQFVECSELVSKNRGGFGSTGSN